MRLLRHDLHTLTGAYAVDALEDGERERFEHHLHGCQSCENEVRGMQETATRLAVAVARVPPAELKVAVLASVARTRQHPPVVDVRPVPGPQARWRPRFAVAAVASAVVIALGITLGVQRGELDRARTQQREAAAALNAVGARIVTDRTSLGGTATMIVARRLDKMIFTTSGLPALTNARVYQLWLLTPSGGATSAGLLQRSRNTRTAPVLAAEPPGGDQIAVTVEPAGGTTQPTTKPIVVLTVPA